MYKTLGLTPQTHTHTHARARIHKCTKRHTCMQSLSELIKFQYESGKYSNIYFPGKEYKNRPTYMNIFTKPQHNMALPSITVYQFPFPLFHAAKSPCPPGARHCWCLTSAMLKVIELMWDRDGDQTRFFRLHKYFPIQIYF